MTAHDPFARFPQAHSAASQRPRILFVDDEPLITRLGEHFLRRLGYDPVTYCCPLAALAAFQEQVFEGVVTDLTMPKMSGIELGREIHQESPGMPIVLTTAYHHLLEEKNALSLGFKGLLLKPYTLDSLAEALRHALRPSESVAVA